MMALKPEILSRTEQATAGLTKQRPVRRDNNIILGSKVKLMRSFVIYIYLYAFKSWALTAELEKRTHTFELRCYRKRTMLPMRRFTPSQQKIWDPQGLYMGFYMGHIWAPHGTEMGFATRIHVVPIWVLFWIWPKWPMSSQPL